jgi:hypothetical protein
VEKPAATGLLLRLSAEPGVFQALGFRLSSGSSHSLSLGDLFFPSLLGQYDEFLGSEPQGRMAIVPSIVPGDKSVRKFSSAPPFRVRIADDPEADIKHPDAVPWRHETGARMGFALSNREHHWIDSALISALV